MKNIMCVIDKVFFSR